MRPSPTSSALGFLLVLVAAAGAALVVGFWAAGSGRGYALVPVAFFGVGGLAFTIVRRLLGA